MSVEPLGMAAIEARDRAAVARLGRPDHDPFLRAEMDRRVLLAEVKRLREQKRRIRSLPMIWKVSTEQSDPESEMQDVEPDYEAMYGEAMAVLFVDEDDA